MKATMKKVHDGVGKEIDSMFNRVKLIDGWLNRVAYPAYQTYQIERIEKKNPRNGGWAPLNPVYAKRKLTKYASAPGGGRFIGVATGKLAGSLVGKSSEAPEFVPSKFSGHRKIVSGGRLTIATTVEYARYFDENRTITKFAPEFYAALKRKLSSYLQGKGLRGV
jgi:hypothetical protein